MDSWDLKKWRKRLGYNQFEAAERLEFTVALYRIGREKSGQFP